MASYHVEMLNASRHLLYRRDRQRGRLPAARVRRSISTSYYALFHFMLEEIGKQIAGATADMRVRRRILARSVDHRDLKSACDRIRAATVAPAFGEFLGVGSAAAPPCAQAFARRLPDAKSKRHSADYDLNASLTEADARSLLESVEDTIKGWQRAKTAGDRDFKHAFCLLVLLGGQLRSDN